MLPPDLDPVNYDDWTDESYMECLRFNFENNPNLFFNIISASGNEKLDFERHWNQKKIVLQELSSRKRMRYNVGIQFRETPWGKFLRMPELLIPESYFARQFQRRFRLPYPLFLQLVDDAKQFNIFDLNNPYSTRLKIPVELKCMIAMRMLGRDLCCDDIFELSYVPMSTCNKIYRQFIKGMAEKVYSKYVYLPKGEEMDEILHMYQKLGLPGAWCSIDGTHVPLGKCPEDAKVMYKSGRYPKPTMAFIVLASHNYQILYCSQGYPGSQNDIQLVQQDKFMQELSTGRYSPVPFWECKTENNVTVFVNGYCISDGGLPRHTLYMDPTNYDFSWMQTVFCEWLESVRKDIECVFGQLKLRFKRLANSNISQDLKDVEYCFKACCALHNMLLKYKGPCKVTNWEFFDSEKNEGTLHNPAASEYTMNEIDNPHNMADPLRSMGEQTQQDRVVPWYAGRYELQRELLMKHFIKLFKDGHIYWPRNFNRRQKLTMNIPAPMQSRIELVTRKKNNTTLYVGRSNLYRKDPINGTYSKSIGFGLFTSEDIVVGERIISFNGETITREEYHLRTAAGRGGYITYLSEEAYLDCYNTRHGNECLASLANCALHCYDSKHNRFAINNAEYRSYRVPRTNTWVASLVATKKISARSEILWPYGASYVYPHELSAV